MNQKLKSLLAAPLIAGCTFGGGEEVVTAPTLSKELQKSSQIIEQKLEKLDKSSPEDIVWALNKTQSQSINESIDQWIGAIGSEGVNKTQEVEFSGKLFGQMPGEASLKFDSESYSSVTGGTAEGSFNMEGSLSAMGGFISGEGSLAGGNFKIVDNNAYINFEELTANAPMAGVTDLSISDQSDNWFLIPLSGGMSEEESEMIKSLQGLDIASLAKELQEAIASVELVKPNGEIFDKENQKWIPIVIDSESIASAYQAIAVTFLHSGIFPEAQKEAAMEDITEATEEIKAANFEIAGDLMFSSKDYPKVFEFDGAIKSEGEVVMVLNIDKQDEELMITAKEPESENIFLLEHKYDKSFDISLLDGSGGNSFVKLDVSEDNIIGKVWSEEEGQGSVSLLQLNLEGTSKNLKGQVVAFIPEYTGEDSETRWVDFDKINTTMKSLSSGEEDVSALANLVVIDIKELKAEGVIGASRIDLDIAGAMASDGVFANIKTNSNIKKTKTVEVKAPKDAKAIEELANVFMEKMGTGASMEEEMTEEILESLEN